LPSLQPDKNPCEVLITYEYAVYSNNYSTEDGPKIIQCSGFIFISTMLTCNERCVFLCCTSESRSTLFSALSLNMGGKNLILNILLSNKVFPAPNLIEVPQILILTAVRVYGIKMRGYGRRTDE
jgi:hypothetical protein